MSDKPRRGSRAAGFSLRGSTRAEAHGSHSSPTMPTAQSERLSMRDLRARAGRFYRTHVRRGVPVLTFHRIREGDGLSLVRLERILDDVAERFTTLRLSDLADLLRRRRPLPRRFLALTFDDATRDQLALAVPALSARGLCGTFAAIGCTLRERVVPPLFSFLHALERTTLSGVEFSFPPHWTGGTLDLSAEGRAAIARGDSPLRRRIQAAEPALAAELAAAFSAAVQVSPPPVEHLFGDVVELSKLIDAGHEVAAHSLWHQDVYEPDPAAWIRDLRADFAVMCEAFGTRAHAFVYPFGKERRMEVHNEVRRAGFGCAATTEPGTNLWHTHPYAIRRLGVCEDTPLPLDLPDGKRLLR